jgi:hypothetical protein
MARLRDLQPLIAAMIAEQARQTQISVGTTSGLLMVDAFEDVPVVWPRPFDRPYRVDLVPLTTRVRATHQILQQDGSGLLVRVTAVLALPAGSQVLVLGQS